MPNLGQLHTAAHRALQYARRHDGIAPADQAYNLMQRALGDYYTNGLTEVQLADFLQEISQGETTKITLHYGHAAFRFPAPKQPS